MTALAVALWLMATAVVCACIGMVAAITCAIRHHLVMLATSMTVVVKKPGKITGRETVKTEIAKTDLKNAENTTETTQGIS